MNVTHSSSPGFGGVTCPCRFAGVVENERIAVGRFVRRRAIEDRTFELDVAGDAPKRWEEKAGERAP